MKYLVAGRIYSDYSSARTYADFLARILNALVTVEAVSNDFENQMRTLLKTSSHPPMCP